MTSDLAERVFAKRLKELDEGRQAMVANLTNVMVMLGRLTQRVDTLAERIELLEGRSNGPTKSTK